MDLRWDWSVDDESAVVVLVIAPIAVRIRSCPQFLVAMLLGEFTLEAVVEIEIEDAAEVESELESSPDGNMSCTPPGIAEATLPPT